MVNNPTMSVDFSKAEFVKSVFQSRQVPQPVRPSVVFAGRSNVGKSSLINSLLRRKGLAKTSSTPGRTREMVYFSVDDRYYFVDIPGYGYAKAAKDLKAKWGPMIEEFLTRAPGIRLIILILDARRDPSPDDLQMIAWMQAIGLPYRFVVTKIDKVPKTRRPGHLKSIAAKLGLGSKEALIPYSSEEGIGRNELIRVIRDTLDA
jgi:GTP-binding protein